MSRHPTRIKIKSELKKKVVNYNNISNFIFFQNFSSTQLGSNLLKNVFSSSGLDKHAHITFTHTRPIIFIIICSCSCTNIKYCIIYMPRCRTAAALHTWRGCTHDFSPRPCDGPASARVIALRETETCSRFILYQIHAPLVHINILQ